MPLDGLTMRCLTNELDAALTGGKIEKIFQPEKDEICLFIRNRQTPFMLLLSAEASNPRVYITAVRKTNPESAPMFCMLLRKHLAGGRVISFEQAGLDRVLKITFECRNELGDLTEKHLFAEIMGRHSNIVLVESGGRVVDAIKRVDLSVSRVRNILPGLTYFPPPPQNKKNPYSLGEADFKEILAAHPVPDKALLAAVEGLSPLAAREICARAGEDNNIAGAAVSFFSKPFSPNVIFSAQDGLPMDFAAYKITQYGAKARAAAFDTISAAMDLFLTKRDSAQRMKQSANTIAKVITTHLDRCKKKLDLQRRRLDDAANREQYKLYGDLITANLYRLAKGSDEATLENYYGAGEPITIPLDKTLSPAENAQRFYTRYRKAKTAEKMLSKQMALNLSEIEYLESVLHAVETVKSPEELSDVRREIIDEGYLRPQKRQGKSRGKNEAAAPKPLSFEFGGFSVFAGKNNRQNDYVTLKLGRAGDVWLHIKDYPGSHVLIKTEGKPVPPEVIYKAAQLAAGLSRARDSQNAAVDYTFVKNVRKVPGAKPGAVIYSSHKTIYCEPLKLSPDEGGPS